jgi:glycosyltransferase involved in cell wall biosynthesis
LESLYREATCLIAASYTEGFGLPLIEAAQYRLPIIARNIPVFHEVAGEHAYYFDSKDPVDLANVIRNWIELYENDEHPVSDNMPWLTWRESAQQLLNLAIRDNDLIKETKKEAL